MDIGNLLIAIYGLIVSPILGFFLVRWRMKDGLNSGKDLFVYLVLGFLNFVVTFLTIAILPDDSWLLLWAYLILFVYFVTYGIHPRTIEVKNDSGT